MEDTYRHKGLRRQLLEDLHSRGIKDEKVLEAMNTLPRHFFLDKAFEEWAYIDKAFPIGNEQTISQPYTVAYQTILLDVHKRDNILEIGTGSGYQAAILSLLGARVYTLERQEVLYKRTKAFLRQLGFSSIRIYFRDGYLGLPEFAPYDKILVTAGATEIPEALRKQLKIGGMMVIPVGSNPNRQVMFRITRLSETEFKDEPLEDCRFVPFLKGVNKN